MALGYKDRSRPKAGPKSARLEPTDAILAPTEAILAHRRKILEPTDAIQTGGLTGSLGVWEIPTGEPPR